ncbi:MAG: hypothetical protein R3236_01650 [Phycisphaeraceae bacterium]|nr:hypothetical protein [Phycisphaeraceae bacterium]
MARTPDPKKLNKRLRKLKQKAKKQTGPKSEEAARRLKLIKPCKTACCGKKSSKQCTHCPRKAASIIFTPLKVRMEPALNRSA